MNTKTTVSIALSMLVFSQYNYIVGGTGAAPGSGSPAVAEGDLVIVGQRNRVPDKLKNIACCTFCCALVAAVLTPSLVLNHTGHNDGGDVIIVDPCGRGYCIDDDYDLVIAGCEDGYERNKTCYVCPCVKTEPTNNITAQNATSPDDARNITTKQDRRALEKAIIKATRRGRNRERNDRNTQNRTALRRGK
jgi:hypothetical protein